VENLNILEVVRAERVVAQVSIELSAEGRRLGFSLAGSGFEGLWVAGQKCSPALNSILKQPGSYKDGGDGLLTAEDVQRAGRKQGETLLSGFKHHSEDAYQWALSRHRWMSSDPKPGGCGYSQASLVDGLDVSGAGPCGGHIVQIRDFGRFFFGELLVSRDAVQLVGIRAELGCGTGGGITACCVGGGGTTDD
jgi:hypothetical protein